MPKRKHHSNDYDSISRKIRKLERKLARKRRSRSRSRKHHSRRSLSHSSCSEYSSRDTSLSPRNPAGEHEPNPPTRSSSPDWADVVMMELSSTKPNVPVTTESQTINNSLQSSTAENASSTAPPPLPPSDETTSQPIDAGSAANSVTTPNEQIDADLLAILGEDPSSKPEFGKEINKELASRLEHIATSGLNKETRKEMSDRYLTPSNCTRIAAPQLNPEIKAALPELTLKRDKGLEARQRQLAVAITCLGQVITSQIQSTEKNNELLKSLMDAIRILCDMQHVDSLKRRYFACSSLKKDVNEQLVPTKIDKFLFGENLADTLKAAKAVSKSGSEIKIDAGNPNKSFRKPAPPQASTSRNLNWRPPPPTRRQPTTATGPTTGAPRSRQPAPPRKHDFSSKPSRHQPRQTRRH